MGLIQTNSHGLCLRHENYAVNNVVRGVYPGRYIWVGHSQLNGLRITRNILLNPGGEKEFWVGGKRSQGEDVYRHLGRMKSGEIDGNVYYNLETPEGPAVVLEKLRAVGHEKSGAYTDPLFINWEKGDFCLMTDSPALKMGIKSIDISKVGLTEDFPDGSSRATGILNAWQE